MADKLNIIDDSLAIIAKDDPKDRIEVELGDSKQPDTFYPQVKIMRWDNEVNASFRLKDFDNYTVNTDLDSSVSLISTTKEVHLYSIPQSVDPIDGGYEFEVVLKEKPKTNIVEFSLKAKGLDFYYQPELNQEQIDSGYERPENVVGSYAVYYKDCPINYVGRKLYRTGKFCHIFRPKVEDAEGNWVWGELHIENGILSVTIPQEFLDNAVYPVRHAAGLVLGYYNAGTPGASSWNCDASDGDGSVFPAIVGGNVSSITIYIGTYGISIHGHLYSTDGDELIDGERKSVGINGWKELAASGVIYAGNIVICMGGNNQPTQLLYDTGDTNQGYHTEDSLYAASPSVSWSNNDNKASLYVTYEPIPEQEGFAFGDDDNNEASHTLDNQDTDFEGDLGTKTLRFVLDNLAGTSDIPYKLKFQKNGSGGYVDVNVGNSYLTPEIAAGDCTESGNNTASDSWEVAYPAYGSGDLLIFHLASDSDVSHEWPATGPNGETINTITDSYGGTAQRISGFWFVGSGTTGSGTLTVTPSASEQWTAVVIKVLAGGFNSTTPIQTNTGEANDTSADTSFSTPAWTSDATADGRIVVCAAHDLVTTNAAPAGWTTLIARDRGACGITVGIRDAANTASEAIASADFTNVSSETDSSFGYVINKRSDTPYIYISTSGNVAAGGEATTARLTAPAGKSGSFSTGRRWDDENGDDSVAIDDAYYTELEWVLTTQSPTTDSDYFEFRIYAVNEPLHTYTLTPKWTIGTEAGGVRRYFSPGIWRTV